MQQHAVIIVNVGGKRERIAGAARQSGMENLRIVHVDGIAFNKSLALNIGIHLAKDEACLMLDADIALRGCDMNVAANMLEHDFFVTLRDVVSGDAPHPIETGELAQVRHLVEFDFRDGSSVVVETSSLRGGGEVRSGPGILLAKKKWLVAVDGYNSAFRGWGWEDIDVILRLQHFGLRRKALGRGLHISERASEPEAGRSDSVNRALAFERYDSGDFKGSLSADVRKAFGVSANGS